MRSIARLGPLLALGIVLFLSSGCSFRPLLSDVSVTPGVISPNADGTDDATNISYKLGRSADVSIYFENEQGDRFYFRDSQLRSPGAAPAPITDPTHPRYLNHRLRRSTLSTKCS